MKNLKIILLLPLFYSCQKYSSPPLDFYEKKLRESSIEDTKGIVIDELWKERDSLSYLRLKNVKFIYLKSVKYLPKWIIKFDSLSIISNTVDKSHIKSFEDLSSLKVLKTLNLSQSDIDIIPESLYKVTSLEYFNIEDNNIKSINKNINQLKDLKSLFVSDNPLTTIPKEVCELSKLESLVLENTKIKELSKCLGTLQYLNWINISGTQITEFPIEILNAPKLETIHARGLKLKNYKEVKAICEKRNITFYYDHE
ncbi:leucine-rich repeat domain-containing protein [Chryseobacterium sp. CBSDS_008]|uniref:leucine-rich repeat domain-containing protein n=1 Tax=Chryseobacterium sp. CBSDS_008 TaxID=3415265 RepID=UPI003CEA5897